MKLDKHLWKKIHKKAKRSIKDKDKKKFVKYIKGIYRSIKCKECKGHMKGYLTRERLSKYYMIDNGLFVWSWKFHNDVNRRIGKEEINLEDAYSMY